jgi:hypothetical protein
MSRKALISMNERRESGYRVAQVVDENQTFKVHPSLVWIECSDDIVADHYWYDNVNNTFNTFPIIETEQFEGP